MFGHEKIYIAGPECFYTGGHDMLAEMKKQVIARIAEDYGSAH